MPKTKAKTKSSIIYRDVKRRIEFDRSFVCEDMRVEERGDGEDKERVLEGYAAVFDTETVICDWYREVIRVGAFKKTIQEYDQRGLWNHDTSKPLARREAGTLSLEEDENGLKFRMVLGNTSWADDAYEAIRDKTVNAMSFGFRVVRASWHEEEGDDETELSLREIHEVILYEVSPVTFPAYLTTNVEANSRQQLYLPVDEAIAESIVIDARNRGDITEKHSEPQAKSEEPDQEHHLSTETPDQEHHSDEQGERRLTLMEAKYRLLQREVQNHGSRRTLSKAQ